MKIELNSKLDLEQLSRQFENDQKLRIENVFSLESAEYILDNLKNSTAWHIVHSDEKGLPVRYGGARLDALTEQDKQDMIAGVYQRAANSYQYYYRFFPIIDAMQSGALPPQAMLHQLGTFLNSADFIGFSRKLTGADKLVKMDPQATLYQGGHFLTTHDDSDYQRVVGDMSSRRYAVVFGFTKNWSADWGGQTSFLDTPNAVQSVSWSPGFNVMTIFKVPVLHRVNYVTPFASRGRYSVTGWLRDDPRIRREDLGDLPQA